MSYPFFSCKSCAANVQRHLIKPAAFVIPDMECLRDGTVFSRLTLELETDDCANNCRGQGPQHSRKRKAEDLRITDSADQYNFQGQFEHLCCFCSLRNGLSFISFADIGCYHCKTRDILFVEFSRLKRVRKLDAVAVTKSAWDANGWSGLTDVLIDYIIVLALNWEERSRAGIRG